MFYLVLVVPKTFKPYSKYKSSWFSHQDRAERGSANSPWDTGKRRPVVTCLHSLSWRTKKETLYSQERKKKESSSTPEKDYMGKEGGDGVNLKDFVNEWWMSTPYEAINHSIRKPAGPGRKFLLQKAEKRKGRRKGGEDNCGCDL